MEGMAFKVKVLLGLELQVQRAILVLVEEARGILLVMMLVVQVVEVQVIVPPDNQVMQVYVLLLGRLETRLEVMI